MQVRLVDRLADQLGQQGRGVAAIIVVLMTATFLFDVWSPLGMAI